MPKFSILYPYFIVVLCLIVCVVGISSVVRMPVDLFPEIKIPVVEVATFYNGMPPEQIENDITGRFERFFTLGSGIEHIESRSLTGVSLIKIFFQPGSNADAAVTTISNLAMADLGRLPPGTLPPVVLKSDASGLPVCLVALKGQGLGETELRDLGQFAVRNQIASVKGASVPQPFGGKYRQIMVYVDPYKLEANQMSVMDVVRKVNESNLILPAGDVPIGPIDYNLYTNSQLDTIADINNMPLKVVGQSPVRVKDVGYAEDGHQIQYNIVRVDGQKSVYLPILKQGGDANTISIVDGVKSVTSHLLDVPKSLVTNVVFDQSVFVKTAIANLIHEGLIGLVLTGIMILVFLGNVRATAAVFLSIPLSALATFIILSMMGSSINSMILGGLALAFSRLIDNSVVVLENIYRHMELGESPRVAAERGGNEVALPVLAATFTTAIVFFPVTFLYGVSQFLFTALALSVVIALFASYIVAMSVVPLYCAKLLSPESAHHEDVGADGEDREKGGDPAEMHQNGASHGRNGKQSPSRKDKKKLGWGARFNRWFNAGFTRFLDQYERILGFALIRPLLTVVAILAVFGFSFLLTPLIGLAYFPRTDPGQFVIDFKAATGTRITDTDAITKRIEDVVRKVVAPGDLKIIASNIGINPDISAIYNPNSGTYNGYVQVGLADGHKIGSYEYMDKMRDAIGKEIPEISTYFQSGGLVDSVLNLGAPAPIDVKVGGMNMEAAHAVARQIADQVRKLPGVSDVLIPQQIDAPSLKLKIDRMKAGEMGLSQKEVVDNIISALTSNGVIAPSYWIDPKTGNDYLMTVQYPEGTVKSISDLESIPLLGKDETLPTRLDMVTDLTKIVAPTEVDHYQLRRTIDVYVTTKTEALGGVAKDVQKIIDQTKKPEGVTISVMGSVQSMNSSFSSFETGLLLAVLLVYLILVAQFRSFVDPFLIMLAVPPGIMGVILILATTGTTLNIMSLMGVVMMVGIVVSNSILIVEFTHRLIEDEGMPVRDAVSYACRVRLRPILMTSLATIFGMIPMAMKLGEGAEAYAPLARAIIGGLTVSVILTVFLVPAAFLLVYRGRDLREERRVREEQYRQEESRTGHAEARS
jgi:hydrophobic/amphiphilic exporter-1 (mainly G- bacteria), HAE1 family